MYDLIIIGAGPAGLTAALYAGRFRLKTIILEKMGIGGQILFSPTIENFPGFPEGIATLDLMERMHRQIRELGIEVEYQEVLEINPVPNSSPLIYNIVTRDKSYQSRCIIIAVGAQPKRLGIIGEDNLTGRGVSYCGTCDGPLFRDKEIVVIGGGDRAIEEVIFLSNYAKKVTLIHRRSALRASKILEEKARSIPKISFMLESIVEEIIGKEKVEAVKIRNVTTHSISNVACQGVFVFAGITPNTDFIKDMLKSDELGFIITGQDLSTSLNGIFACGDCCKKNLYQVITACGDGASAAASVHRYLL